jgi:hypothetical protein
MKYGFTGTRHGMTPAQKATLRSLLTSGEQPSEFHQGDCVGADDEATEIAYELGIRIICHPPIDATDRAQNDHFHVLKEPKTHFARNRDIVNETDHLLATPFDSKPLTHGGTWYTIDYAKKKGKPVTIIWPDGTTRSSTLNVFTA